MTNILVYALLFFIGLSGLFGFLSYRFYGDKQEAIHSVRLLEKTVSSLSISLSKADSACEIQDAVSTEMVAEVNEAQKEELKELARIEALQKKAAVKPDVAPTVQKEYVVEEVYVDIDGLLPPDLTSVLSSAHSRVQGQGAHNTK